MLLNKTFLKPVIFMPFIDPSIDVVAEIRSSIAVSHNACREMTIPKTVIEATREANLY